MTHRTSSPKTDQQQQDIEDTVERMLAAGREIRTHIKGPVSLNQVSLNQDDLYDPETGLPLE